MTNYGLDSKEIEQKALALTMEVLKGIRKVEGVSLETVAEKGGMSKSTLTKMESGNSMVSFSSLQRYSKGIDMDYSTVVGFVQLCIEELKTKKEAFSSESPRDRLLKFLMFQKGGESYTR